MSTSTNRSLRSDVISSIKILSLEQETGEAIAAADAAFTTWKKTTAKERADALRKLIRTGNQIKTFLAMKFTTQFLKHY